MFYISVKRKSNLHHTFLALPHVKHTSKSLSSLTTFILLDIFPYNCIQMFTDVCIHVYIHTHTFYLQFFIYILLYCLATCYFSQRCIIDTYDNPHRLLFFNKFRVTAYYACPMVHIIILLVMGYLGWLQLFTSTNSTVVSIVDFIFWFISLGCVCVCVCLQKQTSRKQILVLPIISYLTSGKSYPVIATIYPSVKWG